eukprot:Gb_05976 [translate_table: standard]
MFQQQRCSNFSATPPLESRTVASPRGKDTNVVLHVPTSWGSAEVREMSSGSVSRLYNVEIDPRLRDTKMESFETSNNTDLVRLGKSSKEHGSLAVDTLGSHKDSIDEFKSDSLPTVAELLTSDDEIRNKGLSSVAIVSPELTCTLENKHERDIIGSDKFKGCNRYGSHVSTSGRQSFLEIASSTDEPNTNLLNEPSPTPRLDQTVSSNHGAIEQHPRRIDGNAYYDYSGVYTTDSSSQGDSASNDVVWSHKSYYNANHEYPQNWSAQKDTHN